MFFSVSPDSYSALSSGKDGLSDRAAEILNDAGYSNVDPLPATHVEAKIAARMRDDGIMFGVLVLNNAPVCSSSGNSIGCATAIPVILPEGARLYVWEKNAPQVRGFIGRGS